MRLAFGVSSSPAIFQNVMDTMPQGLRHTVCHGDDVLITGPDDSSHLRELSEVFDRLTKHNVRLKKSKCRFMAEQVEYMGHLVDSVGLHPTSEKTKAVLEAPHPTTVMELKALLGLFELLWSVSAKLENRIASVT